MHDDRAGASGSEDRDPGRGSEAASLHGRVAVVTRASRGVGRGIALGLGEAAAAWS